MSGAVVSLALVVATLGQSGSRYGTIQKEELEYQQKAFQTWWGNDLVMTLDDLPLEGKVPAQRIPYSGHDYPDRNGGTVQALYKYDRAFHGGRPLAVEFERMDVSAHRNSRESRRGLFGRIRRGGVPGWYGHCNGWTAAAIRHAEPQRSVVRNGVTFTPADIKGLLAELYMYTESEFLGGVDPAINAGTLHLTLTNWLGRGSHPVGMETAVGEVVINYPIYSYKASINKFASRQSEVRMSIRYALNIGHEMEKGPKDYSRTLYFHYVLDTNEAGEIQGGRFYSDSNQIDMLWTPLAPTQGGQEKNLRGNPHMNVKEVLAIWRESVPEELRKTWLNVDPTEEDRVVPPEAVAVAPLADPVPEAAAAPAPAASRAADAATAAPAASVPTPATPATGSSPAAPSSPSPMARSDND
jgi:Transglutaminase elicitor